MTWAVWNMKTDSTVLFKKQEREIFRELDQIEPQGSKELVAR